MGWNGRIAHGKVRTRVFITSEMRVCARADKPLFSTSTLNLVISVCRPFPFFLMYATQGQCIALKSSCSTRAGSRESKPCRFAKLWVVWGSRQTLQIISIRATVNNCKQCIIFRFATEPRSSTRHLGQRCSSSTRRVAIHTLVPMWGATSHGGAMSRTEVPFLQANSCWCVPTTYNINLMDATA